MHQQQRIDGFVREIWQWYARHKRELPWRDLSEVDPNQRGYKILASEIMLQQTQVARVTIIFRQFLDAFPTIHSLAQASNEQVIQAWRGMGYNSRALRLRDAARTIDNDMNGVFPQQYDVLVGIKGIGPYTAAAVLNFAYNVSTPCIDTNIRRIIHRTFYGPEHSDGTWKKDDKTLLKLCKKILKTAVDNDKKVEQIYCTTSEWHAALMDYGSMVCTARNPRWDICPLAQNNLCKAAYKVPEVVKKQSKEPGREIAGRFVPNRIIRGRIVEELRQSQASLHFDDIGSRVCIDWSPKDHRPWLEPILQKLEKDQLITKQSNNHFSLKK